MRREKLVTLFICLGIMVGAKSQGFNFSPSLEVVVNHSRQTDILKQCSRITPKDVEGYWSIDTLSVQKLHANFRKVQKLKPDCCTAMGWKIQNLQPYAFQYLGIIIKGKKFIYVNAFPKGRVEDVNEIPQDRLVNVCDGGTDFWGVLFDANTSIFKSLSVNGGG
ncbi:MAG: hypothetical protein EOP48_14370 [Sphingobacteriales bacterium]|nr:MAG: hypothetical protein EOP48_14370 [Sphingobacteriales bacterium]